MTDTDEIAIYPKVWGEEHWIVNKDYCGKKLVLRRGYRCSIHHHEIKDETFYVITGRVLMEVNGARRVLFPGDRQHIRIGDKHRFTGLDDSEMIEFSTHHMDNDSYRDVASGSVPASEFETILAWATGGAEQPDGAVTQESARSATP
jgi:mannose-6-phosphate isomerase-like protein (cupin superfamily)